VLSANRAPLPGPRTAMQLVFLAATLADLTHHVRDRGLAAHGASPAPVAAAQR
jgi:hypothetical protein